MKDTEIIENCQEQSPWGSKLGFYVCAVYCLRLRLPVEDHVVCGHYCPMAGRQLKILGTSKYKVY